MGGAGVIDNFLGVFTSDLPPAGPSIIVRALGVDT